MVIFDKALRAGDNSVIASTIRKSYPEFNLDNIEASLEKDNLFE